MLAPHHRENPQLRIRRFPAKDHFDAVVLLWSQAVLLDQFRRDGVVCHRWAGRYATLCSPGHLLLMPGDDALENRLAIAAAQDGFARPLWMRHQPGDVSALVADARNILQRAIRTGF